MKAESPGPSVSKLVPRVKTTALILYLIYICMTLIEFVMLVFGEMTVFEAICASFSTAGTGGFGIRADSFASYSTYSQVVVTVFMFLFSINFASYYLVLLCRFKEALTAEVKCFIAIVVGAITVIVLNTRGMFDSLGEAIKHASFTVASLISTCGFATVDFDAWPQLSRAVVVLIMFIGACAGSTGGGIKVSRVLILVKGVFKEIGLMIHPKQVKKITVDKHPVDHEVVRSTNVYIVSYMLIFITTTLLVSIGEHDLETSFTAVLATLNNIGPGLSGVGPTKNFAFFSGFEKIILCFNMLAGRLELFPMLLLFAPTTWKK